MDNFIDLHMHSCYSDDGDFEPSSLVKQCHEAGVRIMAIADHNSVKGIDEAIKAATQYGIVCIPAVEIDCTYEGINLHVLGYGIDHHDQAFIDLENNVFQQELRASKQKLLLTNALGFQLTKADMDEVALQGIYTGEMFGEVLLAKPEYHDHPLLAPYRNGGSRSDNPYVNFYWDFYSQDKPCYIEIEYPTLAETIALIQLHNGISVLAHPGNNLKDQFTVFDKMIQLGIQGVEAFSNYHDEATLQYFYDKGKEHSLLITCGSDYHGKTKPAIKLGECRCFINEMDIEKQLRDYGLIL